MSDDAPEIQYAYADDVCIAYQELGAGDIDLVVVPGIISHIDLMFQFRPYARFLRRLGGFARVACFDKRGQGLSDNIAGAPSLDQRMDDLKAVIEATGMTRPAILGQSEGGSMAALFAATYPEALRALILYGSFARFTAAPDYPWMGELETYLKAVKHWGSGRTIKGFAPKLADDPVTQSLWRGVERNSTTPAGYKRLLEANAEVDIRAILGSIRTPTLVLHRKGDELVPAENGRYLAAQIPAARFVELAGSDHWIVAEDPGPIADEIEEFLTGEVHHAAQTDTVLATVLFMDIVESSQTMARLGDKAWRELIDRHDALAEQHVQAHRGRLIKSTGDGLLATFDGPSRAVTCARAIRDQVGALGLRTRAGLHIGEVEQRGSDIAGLTVNIAARIQDLAAPAEILVTRTITDLVPGAGLTFAARGAHVLKGIPGEWPLLALDG